jgi:hypothetical protein
MVADAEAANTPQKLRFGIMCHGMRFPAWQAQCLQGLLAVPGVEPALLIEDSGYDGPVKSRLHKLADTKHLAFHVYYAAAIARSKAMREVDLSELLADLPTISCAVERKGVCSEYFSDEDVAAIRDHDLDFILRFAFGVIRGEVLQTARLGVWSFHHDDLDKYRGTPPCFWEIMHDDPVSGAVLQRLTDRLDGGIVLKRGYLRTTGHSYIRNRNRMLFTSALWPQQVCREILTGARQYDSTSASRTTAPIFFKPTNVEMGRYAYKALRNRAQALSRLLPQPVWTIGVVRRPISDFIAAKELGPVQWLDKLPEACFVADPFAVPTADGLRVLAEEYDYRTHHGRIIELSFTDQGFGPPVPAIEPGVHSAYPYLLEHEGETYCVPEASQSGEVAMYRAEGQQWRKVASLLQDVAAVDSTVFQHEGGWWLLCTDYHLGSQSNLCAWYADGLFGPWLPHPGNPVKIDVRSSRSAGTPFVHEGELYRPAQDCSLGYGTGVAINRLVRLTPTEFEEETVNFLRPDPQGPYSSGLHTLSACGDYTLVDGMRFELSAATLASRFSMYLKKRRKQTVSPDQQAGL